MLYYLLLTEIILYFLSMLERMVMILRGRPKKPATIDHVTATRLTDEQWRYVCHRASSENLSVGTILRKIVEEHRQHYDN